MLRCRSIASLQRTVSTPPLVNISRASHLDLFEQPAGGFFQHPTRDCRSAIGLELGKIQVCATASRPTRARRVRNPWQPSLRMRPLQLLKTTGRDPEIHRARAGMRSSVTIFSRCFKKIIDLVRVDRSRRYHLLLNYFNSTALSAPVNRRRTNSFGSGPKKTRQRAND